ncbi:MAG: hypothetical protein AAF316_07730 [Cyanobacteria bacterium P01_A01_bin.80]
MEGKNKGLRIEKNNQKKERRCLFEFNKQKNKLKFVVRTLLLNPREGRGGRGGRGREGERERGREGGSERGRE